MEPYLNEGSDKLDGLPPPPPPPPPEDQQTAVSAQPVEWALWLWWVAATTGGYLLVWLVGLAVPQATDPQFSPVRVLLAGLPVLAVSLSQWLVLRRYLPGVSPWLWIGLTLIVSLTANLLSEVISAAVLPPTSSGQDTGNRG